MGTKNKQKSKKGAKPKDKHPRRCKCDECSEKRAGRKWNRRVTAVAREDADWKRKAAQQRKDDTPSFLSGGHPKLKRDFTFEGGDWSEPLSNRHSSARKVIDKCFPNNELRKDLCAIARYGAAIYNPMKGWKLFRAIGNLPCL